jgi:protein-disulfide isomerase
LTPAFTSAPLPEIGPEDHVRGSGRLMVVYGDYECPFCAWLEERLRELPFEVCFRHFPVSRSHPRSRPAAYAAEAAALQGRFWEMHDALFADAARLEDPHLWTRAGDVGLDLVQFNRDRRSPAVTKRVEKDFRGGLRAGVATTPAVFVGGVALNGRPTEDQLLQLASGS